MTNILVCDDDKEIVDAIEIYLMQEGFGIVKAYDGEEAIEQLKKNDIKLMIIDIMMPKLDGIRATMKIREYSSIPILFLSAKSQDTDKILGLNVGADDYITKPFNPVEVVARVRSQLRRYMELGGNTKSGTITVGCIELNAQTKEVFVDGQAVSLTPLEFDILHLLMENAGKVMSPKEIYRKVWKEECFGNEGVVAVHIRHLREKIEINPAEPRYLKVVWAHGYKIEKGSRL